MVGDILGEIWIVYKVHAEIWQAIQKSLIWNSHSSEWQGKDLGCSEIIWHGYLLLGFFMRKKFISVKEQPNPKITQRKTTCLFYNNFHQIVTRIDLFWKFTRIKLGLTGEFTSNQILFHRLLSEFLLCVRYCARHQEYSIS